MRLVISEQRSVLKNKGVKGLLLAGGMLLFVIACLGKCVFENRMLRESLAQKVVRFHVIANSDSREDQELKLLVRDAVGGYMQTKMDAIGDKEECIALITEELTAITQIAERVISEEGFDYPVQACLTECDFPVKTYGEYTFPKGKYEALRIIIGDGEGENWWCVMYPNMCFENSIYRVTSERAKEALEEVLDEEEYQAILSSGRYEIRFRFLEWFR